ILSCVYYASNEKIIIGYEDKGIEILYKDGKRESYSYDENDRFSISSNAISSVTQQGDSLVWVGTRNSGLNKIYLKSKEIIRIPSLLRRKSGFPLSVNSLYTEKNGNLWMGTDNGLYVITTKGDTLSLNKSDIKGNGLSDNHVLCFEEDYLGRMWIG